LLSSFGTALGFWVAAALVLWKHGGDWYRWLTALMLFFFPSGTLAVITNVAHPDLAPYIGVLALMWPLFLIFLFLFPTGRAAPRWMRWPIGLFAVIHFAAQLMGFLTSLPSVALRLPAGTLGAFTLVITTEFVLVLASQVYRYLRVSGPAERRQLQWFVLAIAVVVIAGAIVDTATRGQSTVGDAGYLGDLNNGLLVLIPAAITIAILRYRLWDIDVIIRRTLVYSVLTGLLALIYFGSVIVIEGLLRGVVGGGSPIAIVLSTLVIAALFGPLRARIQRVIDRRFFRRKYDAARTLALFGAQARDVVELEQLQGQLVRVVDETMQPAHVGLWVRPSRDER
jgi:hypothetical protein